MDKFENALHGIEDLKTPYKPMMAKINLLNNIEDKACKITKEILSMDDFKTHANCLNEIRRKSIKVEEVRNK